MAEETEIIYQREADLPVASSPSSIGHLRAVDTDGASALASPDQLREMVPYVGENIARNTNYVTGQWYWFSGQYAMPLTEPIIEGKTYTLSADIMSIIGDGFMWGLTTKWAEEGNFDLIMVTSAETAVIGERKTHTFTASKSYPIGAMLAFRGTNASGGSAKNIKLELGSKSTPWVPASADMAQAMDYSLLTEQVVPGVLAINWNGEQAPVYKVTLRMNAASSGDTTLYSVPGLFSVMLAAFGSSTGYAPQSIEKHDVFIKNSNLQGTVVFGLRDGIVTPGREFFVTIIYTK